MRLKTHPGIKIVLFLTGLGMIAGLKNDNNSIPAMLIGGGIMLVIFGGIVLISNLSRN